VDSWRGSRGPRGSLSDPLDPLDPSDPSLGGTCRQDLDCNKLFGDLCGTRDYRKMLLTVCGVLAPPRFLQGTRLLSQLAAGNGHEAVVRLLLEKAVDQTNLALFQPTPQPHKSLFLWQKTAGFRDRFRQVTFTHSSHRDLFWPHKLFPKWTSLHLPCAP